MERTPIALRKPGALRRPHLHRRRAQPRKPWEGVFLLGLAAGGSVLLAARLAGVSRQHPYRFRHAHPDFAIAWADAEWDFAERKGWGPRPDNWREMATQ